MGRWELKAALWIAFSNQNLPLNKHFLFLGGTNGHGNILDVTRGHFKTSFEGCIRKIFVQNVEINAALDGVHGKNVRACTMEK